MANNFYTNYFLGLLGQIKLFHWTTKKYSSHKALDDLHKNLSEDIDKFVEVYIGKNNLNSNEITDINITMNAQTMNENNVKDYLKNQTEVLRRIRNKSSPELQNIIDNMTVNINQSLYLLNLE
jgi:hypothetical protein